MQKELNKNLSINEVGVSITEGGRHGTFRDGLQVVARSGASAVEFSFNKEGVPGVGFESYGRTVRRELKEIAKANKVRITSVHVPTEIQNISGFGSRGFDDSLREAQVVEVKKAIDFAADMGGSAVVVHSGEFSRAISEQPWNKEQLFMAFKEEPERAVFPLVDRRSGQVVQLVRKNDRVSRAVWNKHEGRQAYRDKKGNMVVSGDYIDYEGNNVGKEARIPKYDRQQGRFVIEDACWGDFVRLAGEMNEEFRDKHGRLPVGDEIVTPEEAQFSEASESQIKIALGYVAYYSQQYEKNRERRKVLGKVQEFYDGLEANMPEDDKWRIMIKDPMIGGVVGQLIPSFSRMPSEVLRESIKEIEEAIQSTHKLAVGQEETARKYERMKKQTVSAKKYALIQFRKSIVELGLHAMDATTNRKLQLDVFVAIENMFPETGYGSHPEELADLILMGRNALAEHLIKYRKMLATEAREKARLHVRATLDTQHLGMWRKNYVDKPGATYWQKVMEFDEWYMTQVKKLWAKRIIGHVHVVDSFGMGHVHLAAGQGMIPVIRAIDYLRKNGYSGAIISEAYGENVYGAGRQLTETWKSLECTIDAESGKKWKDIYKEHFGKELPSNYYPGKYAPSTDWDLWSGTPLE